MRISRIAAPAIPRAGGRPRRSLLAAVILLLAAGCGGDDPEMEGDLRFASSLNVDLSEMRETPSGLRLRDLQVGSGEEATAGRTVEVHYTGWLPEGQQFDSSRGGGPFVFDLGAGDVIPGWDEGVAGMRVGGRRQLVIPPDLAYGERGAGGVIPPGATLVFEVELLGVN